MKPTKDPDVYSLSMVIVEVCLFSKRAVRPDSDRFHFRLVTGEITYANHPDDFIIWSLWTGDRQNPIVSKPLE